MNIKSKSSIRGRITLYFTGLILGIVVGIIVILAMIIASGFTEQKKALLSESVSLIAGSIEEQMDSYRGAVSSIRDTPTLANIANKENTVFGMQKIFLLNQDAEMISEQEIDPRYFELVKEITQFNDFHTSNREELFSLPHSYDSAPTAWEDTNRISYIRRIRSRPEYDEVGYIIVNIDSRAIFEDKREEIERLFDDFYVVDKSGNLIYSMGKIQQNTFDYAAQHAGMNATSPIFSKFGGAQEVTLTLHSYPDWSLHAFVSNESFNSEIIRILTFIIMVGVFGILMVLVFASVISRKITKPIFSMKNAMLDFQNGEVPAPLKSDTDDELGFLISGFNAMIQDIETYVETIYNEQEQKKRAEVYAVKYQLESLQSQINPHFLYNTLNTVKYLASTKQYEQIEELIFALNKLLRSTLSNSDDEITVREELEFIQAYIKIQSYRFPCMIDLKVNVEEELMDCMIPKLILQPLVENAILHGIFPTGKRGMIHLRIARQDNRMFVSVSDNGVGMADTSLCTMRSDHKQFSGIGLPNVNDRLRLLYGEESALHISSVPYKKTEIAFTIPLIREEESCAY